MKQSPPKTPVATHWRTLVLWIAGFVILLDQLSKYLVEAVLPLYHGWTPIAAFPYLRIAHTTNTGAAFGLFPANSAFFAIAAAAISLAIITYNYTLPGSQKALRLALGMQLGGALGNLIDRLRLGHVTDFVDFGPWVFNIADASIVLGAVILAWVMWQDAKNSISIPKLNHPQPGEVTVLDE